MANPPPPGMQGAPPAGPGGYQAPSNPAAVSGPGALSQRTDGGPSQPNRALPNAKYGENKAFQAQQQGAPMAQAPGVPSPPPAGGGVPLFSGVDTSKVVPFGAKTQRPNEPVTHGAAMGPGPGTEALNLPPDTAKQDYQFLRPYLPVMEMMANLPNASPGMRQFVRMLKGGGINP